MALKKLKNYTKMILIMIIGICQSERFDVKCEPHKYRHKKGIDTWFSHKTLGKSRVTNMYDDALEFLAFLQVRRNPQHFRWFWGGFLQEDSSCRGLLVTSAIPHGGPQPWATWEKTVVTSWAKFLPMKTNEKKPENQWMEDDSCWNGPFF